jgi:hypothetical protein
MRFVLVETSLVKWDRTWRATSDSVDHFFPAADLEAAKKYVRDRYPDAYFTDDRLH